MNVERIQLKWLIASELNIWFDWFRIDLEKNSDFVKILLK